MTQHYEANNNNAASCNFAGSASVNTNAPSNSDQSSCAISSCLSNADATFTPTVPGWSGASNSSSGSGSKSDALGNAALLKKFSDWHDRYGPVLFFPRLRRASAPLLNALRD